MSRNAKLKQNLELVSHHTGERTAEETCLKGNGDKHRIHTCKLEETNQGGKVLKRGRMTGSVFLVLEKVQVAEKSWKSIGKEQDGQA